MSAKIFRFARHEDVAAWMNCGWIVHKSLDGTHHGRWAALIEWPKPDEPPAEPAMEAPAA